MKNNTNDKVFQILTVREDKECSQGIHTTLITKPKSAFPANVQERLPSTGAMVKDDFLPLIIPGSNPPQVNQVNLSERDSVSVLLKARKLSQLMAKSWLPDESINNKIIRKLILTANLEPDSYITEVNSDLKSGLNLKGGLLDLYIIATNLRDKDKLSKASLSNIPPSDQRLDRSHMILPDGLNWQLIRVALLVAGQAYIEEDNKQGEKVYTPICEPIASTYDICVYVGFTMVSWSDYVSRRIEFVQPGKNARPPYFLVDLPYPPRLLNESTELQEQDVQAWAYALEEGNQLPFYPDKDGSQYVSSLVKNVVPPYPYLPLSCF